MGVPQSSSLAGECPSLTVVALSFQGRAAALIGWKQPSDWATAELTPTQVAHFVLSPAACRLDQVGSSCLCCYPAHLAGTRAGEGQVGPEPQRLAPTVLRTKFPWRP